MSWILVAEELRPVAALRLGLLPLKEDGRSNPAGLGAWMLGCLDASRLAGWRLGSWMLGGWLACLLAGRFGLDWMWVAAG